MQGNTCRTENRISVFLCLNVTSQHSSKYYYFIVFLFFLINLFNWRIITLQYCSGFCHTLTWISHGCTCVPHPERPSHLPPHPVPLGHPSAPALSTLSHAWNLDWWSSSHMMIYMFQCYSLKSSHPRLLPQSPKDCSFHLCLFYCLSHRVIVAIFLISIYIICINILYWCFSFWFTSLCIIGSSKKTQMSLGLIWQTGLLHNCMWFPANWTLTEMVYAISRGHERRR